MIEHRVINSIGTFDASTFQVQNNAYSLLKEFYNANKSKFEFDEDFNSRFMKLCSKFDCKI